MRPKLHKLLGHCGGEQLAAGTSWRRWGRPWPAAWSGLPPGAALDLHDPVPAGPGAGDLAHLRPRGNPAEIFWWDR
jgi:hypothetical protein